MKLGQSNVNTFSRLLFPDHLLRYFYMSSHTHFLIVSLERYLYFLGYFFLKQVLISE